MHTSSAIITPEGPICCAFLTLCTKLQPPLFKIDAIHQLVIANKFKNKMTHSTINQEKKDTIY